MADVRKILLNKFQGTNLYSNFGAIIKSMTVDGFRGLSNLRLDFDIGVKGILSLQKPPPKARQPVYYIISQNPGHRFF